MYKRVEVLTKEGWRGPIGALKRGLGAPATRFRLYALWGDQLQGCESFGKEVRCSSLFAWTEIGWARYGEETFKTCQDEFGTENVRVTAMTGQPVYSDEYQVALPLVA